MSHSCVSLRDLCDEQAAPEWAERADAPPAATQAFVHGNRDRLPRGDDADGEANQYAQQRPRRARRHQASSSETSQRRPSGTPSRLGQSPTPAGPHRRTPRPTAGARRAAAARTRARALPPSARRIATWCRRVSERARVRPARLAHATARSIPIRPRSTASVVPSGCGDRKARRERCHVQPLTEQRLPLGFRQRGRQRRRLNRRPTREQFRARRVDGHAARETSTTFLDRNGLDGSPLAARASAKGTMMSASRRLKTVETVRRDADHRRRHAVDRDRLADAGTIPKTRRRKPSLNTTTASSDSEKNRPADGLAETRSK